MQHGATLPPTRRVTLDVNSSESPVHGAQELSAYNGHFESVCYHPLFVFNQDGDGVAAKLRPGNVHSADGWDEVLLPVIDRYQVRGQTIGVRADAAFAIHPFRANEVRLLLGVIAYNLGNLLRRLALPLAIQSWSRTSLHQRVFKTGGRLIRHARYYILQLAESHLARRLFGQILGRIERLAWRPTSSRVPHPGARATRSGGRTWQGCL